LKYGLEVTVMCFTLKNKGEKMYHEYGLVLLIAMSIAIVAEKIATK